MIGQTYRYPNSRQIFKLIEIDGYKYKFECGHWCTDCVFADLINTSTNIPNYLNTQLPLF